MLRIGFYTEQRQQYYTEEHRFAAKDQEVLFNKCFSEISSVIHITAFVISEIRV